MGGTIDYLVFFLSTLRVSRALLGTFGVSFFLR